MEEEKDEKMAIISHLSGGFVMKRGDEEIVRFNPSIVTVLFVVNKFLNTKLCYLLCNISRLGRFRKVSRCGVTRMCKEKNEEVEDDIVETVSDGRTKIGAFESATTMSVLFNQGRFADIKIFPSSVHICGLRNLNECVIMLKHILRYFEGIQNRLDKLYLTPTIPSGSGGDDQEEITPETVEEEKDRFFSEYKNNYPSDETMSLFRSTIDTDHLCCTLPIRIQSQDIVMTNYKGTFNTLIDIRLLHARLHDYPSIICNLSTMSNSNALNIIILEAEPFYPPKHSRDLSEEQLFNIKRLKETYLSMSRRNKSQEHIKHSVFIYSSGKFIQSSRKNESSKDVMQTIVGIVMDEIGETMVREPAHHSSSSSQEDCDDCDED